MKQIYQHKDSHLNPEALMVMNQILRNGGAGAASAILIFDLLYLTSNDDGEVNATRAKLAAAAGVSLNSVSSGIKELDRSGLIEYKLSRGKSGNLYRLNPMAVCVGAKFFHHWKELADTETGEVRKKKTVEYSENFKRLVSRYHGNPLCGKKIAAEKKLIAQFSQLQAVIL